MTKRSEIKAPFTSLTAPEREVIFGLNDAEDVVHVYVSSPAWYRKLVAQGWSELRHDKFGAFFELPGNALTIRGAKAVGKKRIASPAQKNALLRAQATRKQVSKANEDTDSSSGDLESSKLRPFETPSSTSRSIPDISTSQKLEWSNKP